MARIRVVNQRGYVLRTRPYSETSLIVDVFSRDNGRVALLAKGARRMKSPRRGMLRPFAPLLLGWSGSRELVTMTQADGDGSVPAMAGAAVLCGYYLNELLLRLLHRNDPHEALFEAYHETLAELSRAADSERVLRLFEKAFLREIGYGLELSRDADSGAPIGRDERYTYVPERGPVRDPDGPGISVHGQSLIELEQGGAFSDRTQMELKRLMRALLDRQLEGRPLHSRRVYRRLREMAHR
jgi:DNA repair protein RecO (recombination protein O)